MKKDRINQNANEDLQPRTIREYPCCMCPAISHDFKRNVCSEETKFLGKPTGKCDFVNIFIDSRGWTFFIRSGLGVYLIIQKSPK